MTTNGRDAQIRQVGVKPAAKGVTKPRSGTSGIAAGGFNLKAQRSFVAIETSSYSGATLLAFLLSAHPEIASIGEMNGVIPTENIETYMCSCGKRIRVCEFWQTVQRLMEQRGFAFDVAHFDTEFVTKGPRLARQLGAASFRSARLDTLRDVLVQNLPGARMRLNKQLARNLALIETVLQVTGKRVFVDTSKDHSRARLLAKGGGLEVRAIHLVRDPRGVVASRLRRGVKLNAREAARQWVRLHERLDRMLDRFPAAHVAQLRYEDLCREPTGSLAQLQAFCKVAVDGQCPDLRGFPHHIVGNPMRLSNYAEIQLDESWRTQLTRAQLDEIMSVAGDLAARYGYL